MGNTQKKLSFLSPKKQKKEEEFIGNYEEAPTYMKDNSDITHGYRINFNNPKKIFKSLFMVHNEIVNIWTHLCPAIFIIIFISYFIFFPISLSKDFSV